MDRSPVRIRQVAADHVVVEPIRPYKDWLFTLFGYARNPFLALLVGVLVTAVFQSSSFTTSFTVGLVATIDFPLEYAIPVIMGANIGTTVTSTIVSLGYLHRRDEFRRAFAAATVHDFFKVLTVLILFTLEVTTGTLSFLSGKLAALVIRGGDAGLTKPWNPLKAIVEPVTGWLEEALRSGLGWSENRVGGVMTGLAVVLLFAALALLVKVLRTLVLRRAESLFDRVLFRNAGMAFLFGLLLTATVQSSSVTISVIVPLVGAGLLTLEQVFPYVLGATTGTTFTALLASFATSAQTVGQARVGLTLACAHLLFNVIGALIFYPLRWMPIGVARALANKAAENRHYAVLFVLIVFFVIPLLGIAGHAILEHFLGQ